MRDRGKTKEQLEIELAEYRQKLSRLREIESELLKTKKLLKENEERYQSLIEDTLIGIMKVDLKGKITYVNNKILQGTGYSAEEMVGKNVFTSGLIPHGYTSIFRKRFKNKLKGAPPSPLEIPFKRKNGERIWLQVAGKTIWKSGLPAGVQITAENITERKQVEKQLRETVQRLNAFGNALPDLAFVLDENGRYVEILTGKKNLLYKEASQITGQRLHDVLPEEVADRGLKAIRRAIETGKIQTMEYQLEVPKGLRMFEAQLSPMSTDDNGPHSVAIVVRDVTQRKEAEESLRENYNYMERLTNSLSDVIFSVKLPERTIEWVNDSVELTGYSKEECIGNTPELFFPNERDFIKFGNKLEEALASNIDMIRVVQLLKKKNGELFYAEITNTFYSEKGQVDHIIGVIRDITESHRLEEEQAKVAKLESIGTLAGGIAHDFNNILTGIMGNIGLARRKLHEGDYNYIADRLEDTEKASMRAKDLTTQLLTFSRGGMPVKKVISLAGLLRDSAMLALRGSNVKLEFSLPDNLWPVEVDEGQINQVINNLVINADHAMPEGGIINIKATNTTIKRKGIVPLEKGDYVKISIEDHGTGIASEHLTKIFDPYFTTKQKGSGLGLSVAYSIIRNHEGYIAVDSQTGYGTKFTLFLPASHETAPPEKKISKGSYTTGEGRILIMDDEATIRKLLKSALTAAGYEVTQTVDGVNAIKEYIRAKESGKPFDVVILDITIPGGMGGKETVKKLLDIDKNARVIVSSGYATDPIMSDYKKYGFSAIVPKPFEISDLEKTLRNVINS